MSSCEDDFAAPTHASHHKNNIRRAACDRCRAQKLRCETEVSSESDSFGKCARCQNADVRCHFSPPGQHGRPPRKRTSNCAPGTETSSLDGSKILLPVAQRSINGQRSPSKGRNQLCSKQRHGQGFLELDKDVTSPSHRASDATISPASQTSNKDKNMEGDFSSSQSATFWDPSACSMPTDEQDLFASFNGGLHTSFDHDSNTPFNGVPAPEHSRIESGADDFAWSLHLGQPCTNQVDKTQQPSMPYSDSSLDFMLPPATPEGDLSGQGRHHETMGGFDTGLGNRKQQLAQLSIQLDRQTTSYSSRVGPDSYNVVDTYSEDLAGVVLESSFAFLDLIASFKIPSLPCENSTVELLTSQDQNTTNDIIRCSTCPCGHSLPSPSISTGPNNSIEDPTLANVSSHPVPSPRESRAKSQVVDITTSLQLLACYMHILHLHSLFYAATRTYMTTHFFGASTSTNDNATAPRPLFPTLQVHGVALTRPSILRFQIKLLLQISLDTLGKIEAALGLPPGYGVRQGGTASNAGTGESYGVLGASVSSQLVAVVMREEGAKGCERIRDIRETVEVLKDELRGEIEF